MDFFGTFWALVPAVLAIALALITKEVYSSLFIGVLAGGLLATGFSIPGTFNTVINDGLIKAVSGNAGIFVFLAILGIIVALINKAGAAKAFGDFADRHIKTKAGALICTCIFGILIFIDDYFNCLTVGAVMTPVTDKKKISRAKLAYIIDATAAPVCMIAPISSWAAAVSGYVDSEKMSGFELFVKAIPFNFYSILTLGFVIMISLLGFDYGKMRKSEMKAAAGDLGADAAMVEDEDPETNDASSDTMNAVKTEQERRGKSKGHAKVLDMLAPILVLIGLCVVALIYNGGFFDSESANYHDFIAAFGDTDATVALPLGGLATLILIVIYLAIRKLVSLKDAMTCIPAGFKTMVPAMLILTLATALKNMTGLLGSTEFVESFMSGASDSLYKMLPAVIFLVAVVISFSTGTSWGTFGILIPIVTSIFKVGDPLLYVGVSACLAGAVCGDHCSPISDTTIMSSAGAQCNHVEHVSTQLPYAITVAGFSFVAFIVSGFFPNIYVVMPVMLVLMFGFLLVMKYLAKKKEA
ncbi:MAG: Na+/H+ antiporter NhaC family protein [Lachnospiraceae bacterium]|nr:Na+/H+ antiporter NhaC family protein [Lachnospiraceae bacterium]